MSMQITPLTIAGAFSIKQSVFKDERGQFSRLFCQHALQRILGERELKQVNFSQTAAVGTVRGLHYQNPPHAEMKLIRCVKGEVWDVVVDLRADSPTFLQWHGQTLSQDNGLMMVIPEGCAHGFQVLQSDSELIYFHSAFYAPDDEAGIHPQDAELAINWPLPIQGLSARDQQLPTISAWLAGQG